MKLTIEEAAQQGVEAHRPGKLKDAERLYRAVLQSKPDFAEVHNNMGIMLQALGRLDNDGILLVKHLLPFEDREKIRLQFQAMVINYPPGIHINKSKNSYYKMQDFEKRRVEQIFAKDFEILGY